MARRAILAAVVLSGCATMQVSTPGRAVIGADGSDYNTVFTAAMQAMSDADFVLKDSDRETGFIYAVKGANPIMTDTKNLQLSVHVYEDESSYVVDVKSNLSGEIVAFGATRKVVEQYCTALATRLPDAVITIDGKVWES